MSLWAYIVPLVMSEGGVAATTRMMNCLHKCSEFLMTPTLLQGYAGWHWMTHTQVEDVASCIRGVDFVD